MMLMHMLNLSSNCIRFSYMYAYWKFAHYKNCKSVQFNCDNLHKLMKLDNVYIVNLHSARLYQDFTQRAQIKLKKEIRISDSK